MRLIHNVSKYHHTSDLFKKMKSLKFYDLVEYKTCLIMYNAFVGKLPSKLQSFFELGVVNACYETKQMYKFKVKYKRTSLKAHCISSTGTKLWNNLPQKVSESTSLFVFKRNLKSVILAKY